MKKFGFLLLLIAQFASAQWLVDGPATLPQIVPHSAMADTPTPGKVTAVVPGGLQTALNAASCGDVLLLQAGSTYAGSYVLPKKTCDDGHYITVRTSAPDSALPAEGSRINPCYAGVASLPGRPPFSCSDTNSMAKIVGAVPILLASGANHYRIGPGLELTRPVGAGVAFNLINPAGIADHIVVDRDWVHGSAQDDTTRGIILSGITYASVVDSYFNDFHCSVGVGSGCDAQAIAGGTGQLPQGIWKIEGNFLEGAAEVILFGGVLKNSVTPANITIRHNHLFKPLIWQYGQAGFVGAKDTVPTSCPKYPGGQCPFVVKNLFELKNAQQLLLEGNVLEYNWPGFSQYGGSLLISGLNPAAITGATVYSTISVANITIRWNVVAHTTAGMGIVNMAGQGEGTAPPQPNLPVSNISVHNNIFGDMSAKYDNGTTPKSDFLMFNISSCPICQPLLGIAIRHNDFLSDSPKTAFILGSPSLQQEDLTFTDNIVSFPSGLAILANATQCANTGITNLSRINACLKPAYQFGSNAMIGASNTWPDGNFFPDTISAIGFVDPNSDYRLLPTSRFKNAGSDGKDLGADISILNDAIANVN